MFGRIVQVILKLPQFNESGEDVSEYKIFRFDERNQESGGENARISFYTEHKYLKSAIQIANIDLYNLDDTTLNWLWNAGGVFGYSNENGFEVQSQLEIELWVGYSDFEPVSNEEYEQYTGHKDGKKNAIQIPKNMWQIFKGSVNSYFNSRKGRDNITHLFCGNMPFANMNYKIELLTSDDITREAWLQEKCIHLLMQTGVLQSHVPTITTNYNKDTKLIGGSRSSNHKTPMEAFMDGDFSIKFNDPFLSGAWVLGSGLSGEDVKNLPTQSDFKKWLHTHVKSEPRWKGDFSQWIDDFCTGEGARFLGYNPIKSDFVKNIFVFDLSIGDNWKLISSLMQSAYSKQMAMVDKIPDENKIRNYEMLLEEPTLTNKGVEIKSLMRPWFQVNDYVALTVDKNPIINGKSRSDEIWTANISGSSNLYQSAWGNDTAIFAAIRNKASKLSFMNVPLLIYEVQHIGDTHKKDWYTQFNTYSPGLDFKRNI